MNKKADLTVVVFVLLVLLLCGFTIFSINSNKNKAKAIIGGFEKTEEWLLEEKDLEYRLTKLGEECIAASFGPQINYLEYTLWRLERSGENFTKMVNECLKERSKNNREGVDSEKYPRIYGMYSRIFGEIDLETRSTKEYFLINLTNFPIDSQKYNPEIVANISFNKIGLIHPERFGEIVGCKTEECIKKITKDLFEIDFETEEIDEKEYIKYRLTSKKEFLIGSEFEKIQFEFLTIK